MPLSLFLPWRIKAIRRYAGASALRILDIGAGNHSAKAFRTGLPNCKYWGLDRQRGYELDDSDFQLREDFYLVDLNSLEFDAIPDEHFDVLVLSHVIEHLPKGDLVLEKLLPKLRPGGIVYVEYPAFRSTRLPSMRKTLNFFDDPTHVRIFTLPEIYNLLMRNGFRILGGGVRRDWARILFLPLLAARILLKYGYLTGGLFWDLMGFAEYAVAKKEAVKE